jgi:hypothetical protein
MQRNDTIIPFFALLFSAALFLAVGLDGRQLAQRLGHAPSSLTVAQIGMLAFAMVFLVYGVMGYVSVWLEGQELRPGRRVPRPGIAALVVGGVVAVAVVACAGLFARLIVHELAGGGVHPAAEGLLASAMFLGCAILLALYKKSVLGHDVLVEEEKSEVPW